MTASRRNGSAARRIRWAFRAASAARRLPVPMATRARRPAVSPVATNASSPQSAVVARLACPTAPGSCAACARPSTEASPASHRVAPAPRPVTAARGRRATSCRGLRAAAAEHRRRRRPHRPPPTRALRATPPSSPMTLRCLSTRPCPKTRHSRRTRHRRRRSALFTARAVRTRFPAAIPSSVAPPEAKACPATDRRAAPVTPSSGKPHGASQPPGLGRARVAACLTPPIRRSPSPNGSPSPSRSAKKIPSAG